MNARRVGCLMVVSWWIVGCSREPEITTPAPSGPVSEEQRLGQEKFKALPPPESGGHSTR